jgi:hypothetical protein
VPKIETLYQPTPLPIRSFDWMANWDNYGGPGHPLGFGATEAEAIADLKIETAMRNAISKTRH